MIFYNPKPVLNMPLNPESDYLRIHISVLQSTAGLFYFASPLRIRLFSSMTFYMQ